MTDQHGHHQQPGDGEPGDQARDRDRPSTPSVGRRPLHGRDANPAGPSAGAVGTSSFRPSTKGHWWAARGAAEAVGHAQLPVAGHRRAGSGRGSGPGRLRAAVVARHRGQPGSALAARAGDRLRDRCATDRSAGVRWPAGPAGRAPRRVLARLRRRRHGGDLRDVQPARHRRRPGGGARRGAHRRPASRRRLRAQPRTVAALARPDPQRRAGVPADQRRGSAARRDRGGHHHLGARPDRPGRRRSRCCWSSTRDSPESGWWSYPCWPCCRSGNAGSSGPPRPPRGPRPAG